MSTGFFLVRCGVDVCFLMFLSLSASLFSVVTEVMIAKTLLVQDHFAPLEVKIGPLCGPGTRCSQ